MLQPGDKKALTILGAVGLVVLALIAGLTTLVVRGHDKPLPALSVQAGDELVRVEPSYWCEENMTGCRPVDPSSLGANETLAIKIFRAPAPVGSVVRVSVPSAVSEGPWILNAQYATPFGVQRVISLQRSNSTFTTKVPSTTDRVLLGVEVWSAATVLENSPAGLDSPDGAVLMRGVFTVDTTPEGYAVTNTTELPDARG